MSVSKLGNIMHKRGQITIFIILGILIALGAMFVFVTRLQGNPRAEVQRAATAALDVAVVQDYVTSCLKQVAERGVRLVGMRGGFLNPQGDVSYNEEGDGLPSKVHYFFGPSVLPYLFLEKKSRLSSLDVIAVKVQNYIIRDIQECMNVSSWEQQGYSISRPVFDRVTQDGEKTGMPVSYSDKKVHAQVLFTDEATSVVLSYPIILERESERKELSDFTTALPLRFKLVHSIAEKLLKKPLSEKYELHKHCGEFAAPDHLVNVYVRTNPYDYEYVVQVVDAKPTVSQKELPLKFQFATRNAKIEGECVG